MIVFAPTSIKNFGNWLFWALKPTQLYTDVVQCDIQTCHSTYITRNNTNLSSTLHCWRKLTNQLRSSGTALLPQSYFIEKKEASTENENFEKLGFPQKKNIKCPFNCATQIQFWIKYYNLGYLSHAHKLKQEFNEFKVKVR